jgi:hypothetical protein
MNILGGVIGAVAGFIAGRWQKHPDGSEIRYRAKWPGRE